MRDSAAKKLRINEKELISNKKKPKFVLVLIQIDAILVILQYYQQTCKDFIMSTAQAPEKVFGCRSNWKKFSFSLLQFYDAAKTVKNAFTQQSCKRPTSYGPNPARTRKYKPEPGPNQKTNLRTKSCQKKPES